MSTTYGKGRYECSFPLDYEVIQILRYFRPLESKILINREHEDGKGVESYLGMRKHISWPNFSYIACFKQYFCLQERCQISLLTREGNTW